MSQSTSSGSTSASKNATLKPTEECSTIYALRKEELEARNNARGLPTQWDNGTVMTKEELIAEEHMWEMKIPEDLKVSIRPFVGELERDLVPQVRAKGEALGVAMTSMVKCDIISSILLFLRTLHAQGETLPSFENLLKKGNTKQTLSSQKNPGQAFSSIFSQLGQGSSTTPGGSKDSFKPTGSTLFSGKSRPQSPASTQSSAPVPNSLMDTDPYSGDNDASDSVNFKDAALASLTISFVKHALATAPDRFEIPANSVGNTMKNHLDKFNGKLNTHIRQLTQFEEGMQEQREIVAQALKKMDELARDAYSCRLKIVELLEELFAPA